MLVGDVVGDAGLSQLDLGVTQAVLVGDVIGDAGLSAGLAAGTAGLEGQLFAPFLEGLQTLLGPSGQVDVDGCPHASAQVGGAGVEVAQATVQEELLAGLILDRVADSLDSTGQTLENAADVTTLLHGDDSELILLVDPGEEGLLFVVVDSPALWPVTFHAGGNQVLVAGHEEEVVVHQLLSDLLFHTQERVVVAGQVTSHLGKGLLHQALNLDPLLLGDSGRETESVDAAANTDPGGFDWCLFVDVTLNLGHVHVRRVAEVFWESMVLCDDRIEDILEHLVRVLVSSIDAAVLVIELDGAGDGLCQSESGGAGLQLTELVPFLLCHMLGDQTVRGLDGGEFRHFERLELMESASKKLSVRE